MTPEERARMARRFFEKLDAALLQRGEPKGATVAAVSPLARAQGEHPAGDDGATVGRAWPGSHPSPTESVVTSPPTSGEPR
jgi:hypothetical protein